MRAGGAVHVGCSGWQYRHWRGPFYPDELSPARWFAHYALHFDTVEINNSFYRLPDAATFTKWREQAPRHFVYAVKASRFLTHMKKLKDPHDPLARFFENVTHLGPRLGPILYQLPPRWPINLERFEIFLRALPGAPESPPLRTGAEAGFPPSPEASADHRSLGGGGRTRLRHVVEFRDPSWYDDRAFELLERHGVALCLHDMEGSESGMRVIGPFIYVRFHFGQQQYGGAYDDQRLDTWGRWLTERATDGLDVFAYFNNDSGGHAPRDAMRLRQKIQQRLAA